MTIYRNDSENTSDNLAVDYKLDVDYVMQPCFGTSGVDEERTEEERWVDVKNYEGLYEVSNLGSVRNAKTMRILKPQIQQKHKYLTVTLSKDNSKKTFLIHRLVAEAFLQNPFNHNEVNHKNCITTDNNASNLEYCCDHSYNINYSTTGNSTISQYSVAGELIRTFKDMNEIISTYPNYNRCAINMVLNGWHKTSYGFEWKYDKRLN